MAWIASSPSLQIPLPLASPVVSIEPIPHSNLVALITASCITVFDTKTLLPLALHTRLPECLQTHGESIEAKVRNVALDTASGEKMTLLDMHVRTQNNFVLLYHISVNHNKSLYEVVDASSTENVLQNSLPLAAQNTKNSLSGMFKSATQSLLHGQTMGSNMASIEHFEHASVDDEQRNGYIPLVKVALVKILKLSAKITGFWCKPNSRNLIFFNGESSLQLLNIKTFKSDSVKLEEASWYSDTLLLEYNANENYFLHVNYANDVSLLQLDRSSGELLVSHTALATLDCSARKIAFNPQNDLLLLETDTDLRLYTLNKGTAQGLQFLRTMKKFSEPHGIEFGWSPCGEFFYYIDVSTHFWQLISKNGRVHFDSAHVVSELAAANTQNPDSLMKDAGFCHISLCAVSSNAQCLFLIDTKRQTLFKIDLVRQIETSTTPLFYDHYYLSRLDPANPGSFLRVPLPPFIQRILAEMQWINGGSLKKASKVPTAKLTARFNSSKQLSLSYGREIAISTPICAGSECLQVYWFQFYNHYMGSMNVVDHIWLGDYLLLINRVPRENSAETSISEDFMEDELVLLNTEQAKYGAGGVKFKFDSDLISWRHTFKSRILEMEVSEGENAEVRTLTIVTHDMKIIMIDFNLNSVSQAETPDFKLDSSKISIRVRRTIHLSSIKHKLAISSLKNIFTIMSKHFFFLLDNGDCFLLKNQATPQPNGLAHETNASNMYELIKVNSAVDRFQVLPIRYNDMESRTYLTLFKGDDVLVYDLQELLARAHEYEDTDVSGDVDVVKRLKPVRAHTTDFSPVQVFQSSGTIGILGFECQVLWKNETLILKQKPGRLSVLDKFVHRDLFEARLSENIINAKYAGFENFAYCLELLLFEQLDSSESEDSFKRVCGLVGANPAAYRIFVNFLRKIEVHYWDRFFNTLKLTPLEFMNKLIASHNVDLCYNYLSIYLNFKKEHDRAGSPEEYDDLLGETEQLVILKIVDMLQKDEKWDECFELCRFIKLLQPSGTLLTKVRASISA
ncbi:hypothetical protein OXX59_004467 [Metschnikowia pulcherrima]